MSSKWATNPDQDASLEAERKRLKEKKKRLKAEKQLKAEAEAQARQQKASRESERPAKRQRKTDDEHGDRDESANLLEFPVPTLMSSRSLEHYDILNRIEEGSYGFVLRAKNRASGEVVALKKLKLDNSSDGFPVTGLREIQTLQACSHPHIVNLREVVIGDTPLRDVYLVMDFIEHDLKDILTEMDDPFSPSEIKTLMRQLCSAASYLHSSYIIHRDLKTSNLLLTNRGELKLADFGMARYTANPPPHLTQLVVTLWYRSPELLLGTPTYSFEIDIWSIGCIFYELLTLSPPFQARNEVSQLSSIFALLGTPTSKSWPNFKSLPNAKALYPLLSNTTSSRSKLTSAKLPLLTSAGLDLLSSMLALNPDDRPSASEVLAHAYFREDPRPKPKEMFPTFPSKGGQERRRKKTTPQAPDRGKAPQIGADDFASVFTGKQMSGGAGFALKMV